MIYNNKYTRMDNLRNFEHNIKKKTALNLTEKNIN